MTIRKIQIALAVFTIGFCSSAFATDTYQVSVKLSHQGEVFASPVVVAREGEPAKMSVGGEKPYSLQLTVIPAPDGKLSIATVLESPLGDMAPTVVIEPGKQASMSVGGMAMSLTAVASGG